MSAHTSPMHTRVHARFTEAFGKPDNSLHRDDHWAVKPSPPAVVINILINGTAEHPAVWVFDPNNKIESVMRTIVELESQIDDIINRIHERVSKAQQAYDGHH